MSRVENARAGWAGVLISAALLSACGGGGGDDTPPPAPPPVQGVTIPDNLAINAGATTDVASATAFSSSAATMTGLTWAWTFGDGGTSTEASPKHDYAKVGDYDVGLKVTNAAGVSKEVKFKVSVNNRAHVSGLSCTGEGSSGWCWQAPRPTGSSQNDYHFLDANLGWSVGDNGEILKTVDGGRTWVKQISGVTARLSAVRFADASNGWAAGEFGAVLRTTDGGTHWRVQAAGFTSAYSIRLSVISAATVWMSDGNGQLRGTVDGGATWTQTPFNVVASSPDGTLWTVDGSAVKRSRDLGKTSDTVQSFAGESLIALTVRGGVPMLATQTGSYDPVTFQYVYTTRIRRALDGVNWSSVVAKGLPVGYFSANSVDFLEAAPLVGTVNTGGDLYRTVDGGDNWVKVAPPAGTPFSLQYTTMAPGVIVRSYYLSGSGNSVSDLSEDAGLTWRAVKSPDSYGFYYWGADRVQRVDAMTWTSQRSTGAWISSDGMQTWRNMSGTDPDAAQKTVSSLWFFDAKRGVALTQGGKLLETVNGGLDWTARTENLAPTYPGRARFQFMDANTGWLLAGDGRIYRTVDGGAHWATPLAPSAQSVLAFRFADTLNGVALMAASSYSSAPTLMATQDGGQSWATVGDLTENYGDVLFTSAKAGVVIGSGGRVATTADGGLTWTNRYSGVGATLRRLVAAEGGVIWAAGDGGALISSRDGGVTWTTAASGTTSTLQDVRFLDAQRGWAVGDAGTILLTADGGKTWARQFSGTQRSLSQVFFTDARTGWVTGADGAVLATGTGGQ